MSQSSFLVGLVLLASFFFCESTVIKPCNSKNLPCIREVIRSYLELTAKDIPTLGLKGIDPAVVKHMTFKHGILKLKLSEVEVKGFENLEVKNFKLNKEKQSVVWQMKANVSLQGNAKTQSGKNGNFKGQANIAISAKYKYDIVTHKGDGKQYFKIGKVRLHISVLSNDSWFLVVSAEIQDELQKLDENTDVLKQKLTIDVIKTASKLLIKNMRTIGRLIPKERIFTDV